MGTVHKADRDVAPRFRGGHTVKGQSAVTGLFNYSVYGLHELCDLRVWGACVRLSGDDKGEHRARISRVGAGFPIFRLGTISCTPDSFHSATAALAAAVFCRCFSTQKNLHIRTLVFEAYQFRERRSPKIPDARMHHPWLSLTTALALHVCLFARSCTFVRLAPRSNTTPTSLATSSRTRLPVPETPTTARRGALWKEGTTPTLSSSKRPLPT